MNLDHSAPMGPVWIGLFGLFGIISSVTMLAVAVQQFGDRYGWSVVAPPGPSGDDFAAGGASPGTSGTYSIFTGHLGVSRTVYRLLDRVYWPGLRQEVRSYLASCSVCLARKSPCPRRAPMGHVSVGHRWDLVAMDILDMSVTTPKATAMYW